MWILKRLLKTPRNFWLCCALWAFSGCIYTFGTSLPRGYNKVYFSIPQNQTGYPLVQDLSLAYGLSFLRSDGRLKPTDSASAKLIIKTTFKTYTKTPDQYDNTGKVISYRIVLNGEIKFVDIENGQDFVKPTTISGNALWFPDRESEEEALKKAIEDFYRQSLRYLFSQIQW